MLMGHPVKAQPILGWIWALVLDPWALDEPSFSSRLLDRPG